MLPTQYLLQKLEETMLALKEYETQVAPPGWIFVWDRWVLYALGIYTHFRSHDSHMTFKLTNCAVINL